jgi:very-short-patch-repair endonuclease
VIADVAAAQHGVITLAQLAELGLGPRGTQHRAAAGRLHRVYRAVYALMPPDLLSREGRFIAAVLACGPGAVLSHRSAAALHDLRRTDRARLEVTVPGHGVARRRGLDVHRSCTLTAADTTLVNGVRATTVARTLFDLSDVISGRDVERSYEQAAVMEILDVGALQAQCERNPGRRGVTVLGALVRAHRAATPTWSELEERYLGLIRAARLSEPEVNAWVDPADGEQPLRVDFLWRGSSLIVETDGHASHRTRQAFERDRRRDQRLTLAGWRVVRVTWRQLVEDPAGTTRLTAGLLG